MRKQLLALICVFSVASLAVCAQEPSMDDRILADMAQVTRDGQWHLREDKDITVLVQLLQQRTAELQQAQAEIARLKSWVVKIRDASRREQATLHYNMGCVYRAARQFDKAEASFLTALALDAKDAAIHFNLGILYDDDLKQKDKARLHYTHFMELSTSDVDKARVQEWLSSLLP